MLEDLSQTLLNKWKLKQDTLFGLLSIKLTPGESLSYCNT